MVLLFGVGSNSHGQLGINSNDNDISIPTSINLDLAKVHIVGGSNHTIVSDGHKILTCGDNQQGQLGRYGPSVSNFSMIQALLNTDNKDDDIEILDISAGWDFSMIIAKQKSISHIIGFGSNKYGILGMPPSNSCSFIPVLVHPNTISHPYKICCGVRHVLVACKNDENESFVYAWGETRYGKLGYEESHFQSHVSYIPQKLDINESKYGRIISISVGHHHSAVLTSSGIVHIFGRNKFGIFTNDDTNMTKIDLNSTLDKFVEWSSIYSCWNTLYALCHFNNESFLIGWGRNNYQQLSQSIYSQIVSLPVIVSHSRNGIKKVACGSEHILLLMNDGSIQSLGWNEHGNCNIELIDKVKDIGCGYSTSFVVTNHKDLPRRLYHKSY